MIATQPAAPKSAAAIRGAEVLPFGDWTQGGLAASLASRGDLLDFIVEQGCVSDRFKRLPVGGENAGKDLVPMRWENSGLRQT